MRIAIIPPGSRGDVQPYIALGKELKNAGIDDDVHVTGYWFLDSMELVYTEYTIACTVSDDGLGFDPEKTRTGFGLRSMQERANALGGTLTVESTIGKGTRISLLVPISASLDSKETYPNG